MTPQAAALAVGFSPSVARDIGNAAWAPDTDDRSATHWSSILGGLVPFYSNADSRSIHLLTGGSAAQVQRDARAAFTQVLDAMSTDENLKGPRFTQEQENILHAFGDSFAHVDRSANFPPNYCPCMFSLPTGHLWQMHDPDDPSRNSPQYRRYLGALYDTLGAAADQRGLPRRWNRDTFIFIMMNKVSYDNNNIADFATREKQQTKSAQEVINYLEQR